MRNEFDIFIQNCLWSHILTKKIRFRTILKYIVESSPDISLLQEAVFNADRSIFQPDGYSSLYKKDGVILQGGLLSLLGGGLKSSGFQSLRFNHQGKIFDYALSERILGKGFQVFFVEEFNSWFVNTHFHAQHQRIEKKEDYVQTKQLRQLLLFCKDLESVFLCGDFNFTPFSTNYLRVIEEYVDFTNNIDITFPEKSQKLDYVFYKGSEWEIVSNQLVKLQTIQGNDVSDHIGITLRLTRTK